jgi:curved DNA-binding protein CbpA
MFVDYYELLEIDLKAADSEIKKAFKIQAVKWHPDRNHNVDTTAKMQLLNEAYLILKDQEARLLYDSEYLKYKNYQLKKFENQFEEKKYTNSKKASNNAEKKQYEDYAIFDKELEKWILNARKQAIKLASRTIEEFKGISSTGLKATAEASFSGILTYIILSGLSILIFSIYKSCN